MLTYTVHGKVLGFSLICSLEPPESAKVPIRSRNDVTNKKWRLHIAGNVCMCLYAVCTIRTQVGRGHWTVYYTSPYGLIIVFSHSLSQQLWGRLPNFDWLFHYVECPSVSTINYNLQKEVVLCISVRYKPNYRQLSYPFRSLHSLICFLLCNFAIIKHSAHMIISESD